MNIAILGLGGIAEVMAHTIKQMKDVECYACGSRNLEKAEQFKEKYGFKKAYGSYEELVLDDNIDLVYIATPHAMHYENMLLCLKHNKAILCEKAFTVNKKQTEKILEIAKEKNILVAEAIWTRYMPSRKIINDLIESNIIGDIKICTANLGYKINHINRIIDPKLAGGSLLDVGVYPINFATMVFKEYPSSIEASATYTTTNVDETCSITLNYTNNKKAILYCSMIGKTNRIGSIVGTLGYINITNINNVSKIEVFDIDDNILKSIEITHEINGYEYQIEDCVNAIKNKQYECDKMPHEEIIKVMEVMDNIREKINLVYPKEIEKCE